MDREGSDGHDPFPVPVEKHYFYHTSPEWLTMDFQLDSQAFATAVAASFICLSVTVFGHAEAASAFDAPSFTILQREKVITSPSRNSIEVAFQGFFQKGSAPISSRAINTSKLSTLRSTAQSTTANKESPIKSVIKVDILSKGSEKVGTQQPAIGLGSSSTQQPQQKQIKITTEKSTKTSTKATELQATDIKTIAEGNKIDVELICNDDQRPLDVSAPIVKIDRETFQKVKVYQPPFFLQNLPSSIKQKFQSIKVLKSIPSEQLFLASVIAGSLTEMVRTSLLYPLGTVKVRTQARSSRSMNRRKPRSLLRKLRVTWLTFVYETKRGDLYAGILPSLLVTVPASGVYSGTKEVSRRAFSMAAQSQVFQNLFPGDVSSYYSILVVNLLAAFVADVASLAIRTPADVLALRLQVFGNSNVRSDFGSWAKDSVALLPAMLVTELPFLMSRILVNAAITTSGENLGRFEFETITVACLCAFLTTPFDVARTRILLPTLPSEEEAEDSGSLTQSQKRRRLIASSKYRKERRQKLSVLVTMKNITKEGNGGVQNLYAGWFERTAFLGVGRAWLDPIRVIGYLGIRDALLLKLFD